MYEVLVAGGGPAGCAVAIHLARLGRAVLLLDRANFPRRKACGEGIFPPGVAALNELGVLNGVRATASELRGIRFSLGGESVRGAFRPDSVALGVQRRDLDAALVAGARAAGVDVREGVTVRSLVRNDAGRPIGVRTDMGVETARVIVGADGLNSRLRQQAGLDVPRSNGRYGVTAHVEAPGGFGDEVDVRFRRGYEVYVTPAGCDVANVALLGSRAVVRQLAQREKAGFRSVVEDEVGGAFGAIRFVDEPIVQGPFPVRSRHVSRGRLVLAGDAAGFFDGISGEGISLALLGAKDCATAVDQALRTNSTSPFRVYEARLRRRARNSTLLAHMTLFLAGQQRLGAVAIRNLSQRPESFEKLIAINAGQAGFRHLHPARVVAMAMPWLRVKRAGG